MANDATGGAADIQVGVYSQAMMPGAVEQVAHIPKSAGPVAEVVWPIVVLAVRWYRQWIYVSGQCFGERQAFLIPVGRV